jgi:hypothetical protein
MKYNTLQTFRYLLFTKECTDIPAVPRRINNMTEIIKTFEVAYV